ncbi:Metalloenzyme, LuxS/M16 peptidase-like protein [Entophlyctis helioformis]|nr:Metalloenzyme, LuxS/M16 peptidase-like protein [Entophlyctis helioformis]
MAPSRSKSTTSAAGALSVTTLPNGLRVASQASLGHFAAVGVYVDAGSRFETPETSGCSHLTDRMAFKSTKGLSAADLVKQLEHVGGNVMAHSSREAMMYQAAIFHQDVPKVMSAFGHIIRDPLFKEDELNETREATRYELSQLAYRTDMLLPEALHGLAYQTPPPAGSPEGTLPGTNTLGNPLLISDEALESMTTEKLLDYHKTWYTPNRIVVAGVGMEHDSLVEMAEREFGQIAPITPEIAQIQREVAAQKPKYTGGIQVIDTSSLPPSPNPDDMTLTHVHLAFESVAMTDPDVYALATLTSLMGGGGSFSAGGPGKGMYTRLYTQVLNRHSWVESCHLINYTYADTGLLAIQAAVLPDVQSHQQVAHVLAEQLLNMTTAVQDSELSRAKNQLKSNLLMSLESKIVELEDVGRQVLNHNRRLSVVEMCRRIDLLTQADLVRVARRVIFGETIQSPLDFGDDLAAHWTHTGTGEPTALVYGPLVGERDPLHAIGDTLSRWGIGRSAALSSSADLAKSGRSGRRSWFSSLRK